jgi:hypothetical protein
MGEHLADYWRLEEHKLGETTFTHFADGTAHKNRMQGNDFVQSVMYRRGVTCASCHDVHGTANNADLVKPGKPDVPGMSRPELAQRTSRLEHRSSFTSSGRKHRRRLPCLPYSKDEQTMPDDFVRSHTFKFITPKMTEQYKIPNPCTSCHQGKTIEWAKAALKGWRDESPWRVVQ